MIAIFRRLLRRRVHFTPDRSHDLRVSIHDDENCCRTCPDDGPIHLGMGTSGRHGQEPRRATASVGVSISLVDGTPDITNSFAFG